LRTVATPQLSEVVGTPSTTPVAKHAPKSAFTVAVAIAEQLIAGDWISFTITVCSQLAVLPWMSVTVQITTVVPTGKLAGALRRTVATPQLSEVIGAPNVTPVAKQAPGFALTVTVAGQVIAGAWMSFTITVCSQVAVLPWISVTVQVTTFVPTGKLAGALLRTVATPQLSEVVGTPSATPVAKQTPRSALTVTVAIAEQVITGAWISFTITVSSQLAVLPWISVTVQV